MSSPSRVLFALLAMLGGLQFTPAASCQPMDLDWEETSPVWWTLTEELSPTDLRQELRSPLANQRRFEQALSLGARLEASAEDRAAFFVDPSVNPELVPLWLAFDIFARVNVASRLDATVDLLRAYGLDAQEVQRLIGLAQIFSEESAVEAERFRGTLRNYQALLRSAPATARGSAKEAYSSKRSPDLADALSISLAEAESYISQLTRDPYASVLERQLPMIQTVLAESSWLAFKRFLLAEVASGMGPILTIEKPRQAPRPAPPR